MDRARFFHCAVGQYLSFHPLDLPIGNRFHEEPRKGFSIEAMTPCLSRLRAERFLGDRGDRVHGGAVDSVEFAPALQLESNRL